MPRILVTGSEGFLGKNLCFVLHGRADVQLDAISHKSTDAELFAALDRADIVFHLAGVNRAQTEPEFAEGNAGYTRKICGHLAASGHKPEIVYSSTVQALRDNVYGKSKLAAEEVLREFSEATCTRVIIHRLTNLFGKWSRPNYNSVTATFCHNIARDLPIEITDEAICINLSYVDDVIDVFLNEIATRVASPATTGLSYAPSILSKNVSLGELAALIRSFNEQRKTLMLADYADPFVLKLYATYLSFLPPDAFAYDLSHRTDDRGALAEFVKTTSAGQIFVSRTKPGVTRGNHYHHTKTEKFLVVEGTAKVRFRNLNPSADERIVEYTVRGEDFRVVDIPPGYTHSIENIGAGELVTLFWASEILDETRRDTFLEKVDSQDAQTKPQTA